jgi:hypothetical protein
MADQVGKPQRLIGASWPGRTSAVRAGRGVIITGICAISVAATIGFAASSHASVFSEQFQSPSGDISCNLVNYPPVPEHLLGENFVQCDIADHSWAAPQPPPQGRDDATTTFILERGRYPIVGYRREGFSAVGPIMDSSRAQVAGVIACSSEQSAVTCTDASTGHFFRLSQQSYQLG